MCLVGEVDEAADQHQRADQRRRSASHFERRAASRGLAAASPAGLPARACRPGRRPCACAVSRVYSSWSRRGTARVRAHECTALGVVGAGLRRGYGVPRARHASPRTRVAIRTRYIDAIGCVDRTLRHIATISSDATHLDERKEARTVARKAATARAGSPRTAARVARCTATSCASGSTCCSAGAGCCPTARSTPPEADAARRLDHRGHRGRRPGVSRRQRIVYQITPAGTRVLRRARSPTSARPPGRTTTSTCGSRSSPAPTPRSGCASSRAAAPGSRSGWTAPAPAAARRATTATQRAAAPRHRVGRARGPVAHRPDRRRARDGPTPARRRPAGRAAAGDAARAHHHERSPARHRSTSKHTTEQGRRTPWVRFE